MKIHNHNLDSWEAMYLKSLSNSETFPMLLTDEEVYLARPDKRWIYDKYYFLKRTDNEVYDLSIETPEIFPCIVKPRINLMGMGKGAYKANSIDDIKETNGFIAQPFVSGTHLSTDFVFWNGELVDHYSFECHKDENGSFNLFESTVEYSLGAAVTARIISDDYCIVNVETIDSQVIEAQFRPSMQFFDICGGMIEQYMLKSKDEEWEKTVFEKTYSLVHRVPKYVDYAPPFWLDDINCGDPIRSVQCCWEPGKSLSHSTQDEYSNRVFVINGTNLDTLEDMAFDVLTQIAGL